nr:heme utilization cystosolic carrier protein HutX [Mannheimia massilioguelmaensis]
MSLTEQQRTELTSILANKNDHVLEMLAHKYDCSYEDILSCLPQNMAIPMDGERFVEIMQTIASWDEAVVFIAHTPDAVIEVTGKLPHGEIARGYYNMEHHENGGLHGHYRYVNCKTIYLVDRHFMNKRTVAINFINKQGDAMFKIFASREENGELKASLVDKMKALFTA